MSDLWVALFGIGFLLFAVGAITSNVTLRRQIPHYPVSERSSIFLVCLGLALMLGPAMLHDFLARGASGR
jgi:hypothetical protein